MMKRLKTIADLFFDQLQDACSMKMQLAEALPRPVPMAAHAELREWVLSHSAETSRHFAAAVGIFKDHFVPAGQDRCKAIAG